ncbi:unnamed protein product [Ostreobium quekettii]|uniref:Uncharacterized protein n=1 Tax=Ostreobium quekettii TaxID=121088 RepID=A0A8S1JD90_9CHLO|nr:unnamed protein product [Ostreobium quekettii]
MQSPMRAKLRPRVPNNPRPKRKLRPLPPEPPPKRRARPRMRSSLSGLCENQGAKRLAGELAWMAQVPEAPTYHPSEAEFEDPLAYIAKIEPEAERFGICKIVPPRSMLVGRSSALEGGKFGFSVRQQKLRDHRWQNFGHNDILYEAPRTYSLREFMESANDSTMNLLGTSQRPPESLVEALYWMERERTAGREMYVDYGNDVEGTAFHAKAKENLDATRWNLRSLGKDKSSVLRHIQGDFPGITSPMLYVGSLFASFYWHVEDHFLHSINFAHCGATKTWYGVAGCQAKAFEEAVFGTVYADSIRNLVEGGASPKEARRAARTSLLRKTTMVSPKLLRERGVGVVRISQGPGDFVVTFPRAYHAGFSHGFNCGEAVNFGLPNWFPMGQEATNLYSRLGCGHIIAHEEMLCKEAGTVLQALSTRRDASAYSSEMAVLVELNTLLTQLRRDRKNLTGMGSQFKCVSQPCTEPCAECGRHTFLTVCLVPDPEGGDMRAECLECAVRGRHGGPATVVKVYKELEQFQNRVNSALRDAEAHRC